MIKTILILTIAAAFMVGTSMSLVLSDYEAEAKPKKTKPIQPILVPINSTLNQLESYQEQLAVIDFKLAGTVDGIATNTAVISLDEAGWLREGFVKTQDAALDIIETADEAIVILDLILD